MAKKIITAYECTCERCGAVWLSRVDDPIRCAKCKTQYWNTLRRVKTPKEVLPPGTILEAGTKLKRRKKPKPRKSRENAAQK
jgi:tRNA(Ile2) C34 agmatinyltransferase TiaS